jgi:hypothetical protein
MKRKKNIMKLMLKMMVLGMIAIFFTSPALGQDEKVDTLVITALLTEIPGKFASNDLYNYVYIMKYKVLKIEKGSYTGKEILVGHYNPLIPRAKIKDKMDPLVNGNITNFKVGAKHHLILITPISAVWEKEIEESDYADSELDRYYALQADDIK